MGTKIHCAHGRQVVEESMCMHSYVLVTYDSRDILIEATIYVTSGRIKRITLIDDCFMTPSEMALFANCVNELPYRLITDDEMEDYIQ